MTQGINGHLRLHIYKVFRLPNNASKADVKKRYNKLSLRFHPDKISQGKGRAPTRDEKNAWDDIAKAFAIFNDVEQKRDWDQYDNIMDAGRTVFQCLCDNCMRVVRCIDRHTGFESNISLRWFCTQAGAQQWEALNGYTTETHGYAEAGGAPPPPPPPPPLVTRNCPQCGYDKPFQENGKWWVNLNNGDELFCSHDCLYTYCRSHGINAKKCAYCGIVKTWRNSALAWVREKGEIYCGDEHKRKGPISSGLGGGSGGTDPYQADRDAAIADIDNALNQNPTINTNELETTNQNWRHDIQNANDLPTITAIKNRVLADIQNKRHTKQGGGGDPLLGLKNTAIAEIDGEMLKDPEIQLSELEAANQNYGADILAVNNPNGENQINQIKDRVLADIRTKRQTKTGGGGGGNKNLDTLRQEAINQIRTELSQQPAIDESQLANQNWEAEINRASSENAINEIRDQTLANIRSKRAALAEKNRLNDLLIQARQEENWNNYQNLANILSQIKELRSSNGYEEKESEIQAIENRLRELNPDEYKQTQIKLLDQQIENNNLTDSNMDEETKAAVAEAKADPTPEKMAYAEEKVAQNGVNNSLTNLLTQIRAKIKNLSPQEKQEAITKILEFIISENKYQKQAYQKEKPQVDALLAELRGQKSQDSTNPGLTKVLVPILIIGFLGIVITGVLIWRKKRQQKKLRRHN
ncbi:Conserved protein of unknown function [endosymbiont DhMRE of Dentiscutata heterogama]|uniref:DnaJ domain-containing protein n=1 Tax=endosymbiont DhMRE of Dentiscutata heterogama TaxID=1609546 RepID=UPI000629DAEC|nr:DnaJ domain-containing protein [endosymbiont DhMRE of Dentiscutata heterogama]CFW92849.1 Conserved protein of unknown function [endosymbiont DhMRE of Dentiscutata heterogama]